VSDELGARGLRTDIPPTGEAYFMKPLISAMAAATLRRAQRRHNEEAHYDTAAYVERFAQCSCQIAL
jgi:hypothetical protein